MGKFKFILINLVALVGFAFLFGGNSVQARVVTDDEGEQVDIPDSYFLKNAEQLDAMLKKQGAELKPITTYWVNHPDTQFSELSPELSKKLPDLTTFNEMVKKIQQATPQYSLDDIRATFKAVGEDPYEILKQGTDGFLDTEKVPVLNPYFTRIVKPSDMTYYNQTGNKKVDYALDYAFGQWSKDPRFKFRRVNDPKDAKIIVTDLQHSKATQQNYEPNYEAAFIPTVIYDTVLVQGQIVLSPQVLAMAQNDPNFLHIIVHEVGHSIGRVDLI